ncbi:SGNH/GDSL hydrolase family protein [uncultured Clostridium sp.]|uniref:SGNH/GDSL hydrolase family protein n=1 Tax=uncultured Clostridium sp. TaxID=59620 RepID=UPI0028EB29BA|nr:SGNH/GDSL hydrolase family protein [uncultured Clostridium sp.]
MKENERLKVYKLSDINNLKIHGRTTGCFEPLTLFWTGSAIELNAKGSELWIEVESDYDIFEQWISITINSVPVSRQMLNRGRHWICVFRGMDEKAMKNVRIIKEVQPMSEDINCYMQIHRAKFDGEFLPIKDKSYKIEFIGDSITSGEGAIGAKEEEDWIPMFFSALNNYTAMTAEALNAEYRVISQSGWGVLTSWNNNPHENIPEYYEKVCGVLKGEKNKKLGALKENDFSLWKPDIVVVNLGTNDAGAFDYPEWKDEITGEIYKQRLNDDGSFNEEDIEAFERAVENFIVKLRKYNKKAHIIWVYGMLGLKLMPYIYRAVDSYVESTNDRMISAFQLPNTTSETVGARSHPGLLAHEEASRELTEYIKEILII